MHELAIAQRLIDTACAALPAHSGPVTKVQARLGRLAGLSSAELAFGFEIAALDTPLAGARLEIEEVPARIYCPACGVESELDATAELCCPRCGAYAIEVTQGKDLLITSLEVEE
ncbi:MAG: hydrogenase maturation nickel metallochaperone HypA [Caldilineaceae bacterium]